MRPGRPNAAADETGCGGAVRMAEYGSIEKLLQGECGRSVHIECGQKETQRAMAVVRRLYCDRRTAFYLLSDKGFDRESVRSYLTLFARLAGCGAAEAVSAARRFGLDGLLRTKLRRLSAEERALANYARMSLVDPDVCFCERPLYDLGPDARARVLAWMGERVDAGGVLITCGTSLRDALLMGGEAFWENDEGRFISAQFDEGDDGEPGFAGDEVRVCKVVAQAGSTTLLFDPREVDFIESMNKVNYVSVRGELYPTQLTLDELEVQLEHAGFFRCHRSYIVNVQKVARVERYTRNAYNLTLNDGAQTCIPLAKGRADEMRERFHWN